MRRLDILSATCLRALRSEFLLRLGRLWSCRYDLEPILIILQATRIMLLLVLSILSSSFILIIVYVLLMCASRVLVYVLDIISLFLRGLIVSYRLIILRILILNGLIDDLRLRVGLIVWYSVFLHLIKN